MAFETDYAPYDYSPGAAMAAEAIPFPFLDAGHLVVTHIADATGAATVLVPDADYVIAGNGSVGAGTIAATAEWPGADLFRIERRTPAVQKAVLPPGQPIPSKAVEGQLDRQAMVQQEAGEQLGRALVVPIGMTPPRVGDFSDADGMGVGIVDGAMVPVPSTAADFEQAASEAKEDIAGQVAVATGAATAAAGSAVSAANKSSEAEGHKIAAQGFAGEAADALVDATTQAGIAATAAAAPALKVQTDPATPTVPPSGVASGEYYWAVSADLSALILHLNTSGTGAVVEVGAEEANIVVPAKSAVDAVLATVDRDSPYPRMGLETVGNPVVQPDTQVQSWQTRDGRELRVRPDALEGVDRGSRYAAFVQPGTGNLIVGNMTSGASITIPRIASWAGGPTLDYQLAGWAGGLPLIATSRALKGPISLMMASTAGMAPAFDPKVMYITFTVGQSTGGETNGKKFDATRLYAPMTMPPGIFMPQRNGHSDLRCARYSDWDSGLSVPTDPTTITGIMPFGPRPLPNNTWTSQVFGDGMLSRILKVQSDRFHAVHGRRQPMLGASLAFGGISNLNRSKTGAANIPGYSITAYANNLQIMTAIRDRVIAAGYTPVVLMVFDAHGETGAADTNYATVEAQYQADLNADIRAIFDQAGDPVWIEAGITSAFAATEVESVKAIRANHNNGKILIAGADYELLADQGYHVTGWPTPPNSDYVHFTNRGYHRRGEAAGHVGADMLCLNRTAKMTQPVPGASLTNVGGNVWRWPFESESGTIEIASSPGFDVPANAGVTYRDSGGGATINSVALAPGGTGLDITMSTDVSARPGREWRIAMNGPTSGAAHSATAKGRSPVRDPVPVGVSEATGATRWRHTLPAHAN